MKSLVFFDFIWVLIGVNGFGSVYNSGKVEFSEKPLGYKEPPIINVIEASDGNGATCLPNYYPLQDYDPMNPKSVPTYNLPKYDESFRVGPNLELDPDVKILLDSLTLEEKAGQMVQIQVGMFLGCDGLINVTAVEAIIDEWKIGSVFEATQNHGGRWNINSPQRFANLSNTIQSIAIRKGSKIPLIWGLDTIRGANYVKGATTFPAPVNIAATFNPIHAYNSGSIGAKDTRAAGVHWAYSPLADINRQKLWSRNFENFGEDPFLVGQMVYQNIKGLQGNYKLDRSKVAACIKHFIGYSDPQNGKDRDPTHIPLQELAEYFIPPFKKAIDAGVATVMEAFGQLNGQSIAISKKILRNLLRDQLNFNGTLITDWGEVNAQWERYFTAFDIDDSTFQALSNTSIDMSMTADDIEYANSTINLVKSGKIPISRINESVGRILQLKKDLGILQTPYSNPSLIDTVGSAQDVELARNAARESIILLKNDCNVLPISKKDKVLFVGAALDSIGYITGAWSVHWQGATELEGNDVFGGYGESILDGIKKITGDSVNYIRGYNVSGFKVDDYDHILQLARKADKVVFCLGEKPSTEGIGDIDTLSMARDQYEAVKNVAEQTSTPIILLLAQNRPFLLGELSKSACGIINANLPGPYGGLSVAEILYGEVSPSARQPYTYPKFDSQAQLVYYTPIANNYDPEFSFGQGMGYNNISYSQITVNSTDLRPGSPISISITATNNGKWIQNEPALMFTTQKVKREYVPERHRLRSFRKQRILPGESKTFKFSLSAEELSFIDEKLDSVTSEGPVIITINAFNKNSMSTLIYLHER
ncbi:Lysosomal beta glucosidase [Smittium mucronatum]|uniref:beta-glucosidase n=1 Tax=Smittium mucronatum TaxID=133383 RepID=A0A1R0GWJ5_9FUNG|nr:Lysosomal beta glucosidase [Smittium mucronatum]